MQWKRHEGERVFWCVCVRVRERDGERERALFRQTDRQTDRQIDRQTDSESSLTWIDSSWRVPNVSASMRLSAS
jgi:hypothetical protein